MSAAIVDLGAAKVACLIPGPGGGQPAGLAVEPLWAARRNDEAAARALRLASVAAEEAAGHAVEQAIACHSGRDLRAERLLGAARCTGTVDVEDARRALLAACANVDPDRVLLHLFPLGYRLDGGPLIGDPRGKAAKSLGAEALAVTAAPEAVDVLRATLAAAGLTMRAVVAGPFAAGLAALSREERMEGAVVIDLGASATGIAAFFGGALLHMESLPLGQTAVTEAVASLLQTTSAAAEQAKHRHLTLAQGARQSERIEAGRLGPEGRLEPHEIARAALAEAAARPIDAIFQAAAEALAQARLPAGAERWRATLVGGGAEIPGIATLASATLARPVRLGRAIDADPHAESATPGLAAAMGALRWGLEPAGEAPVPTLGGGRAARPAAGVAAAAWRWLRDNF